MKISSPVKYLVTIALTLSLVSILYSAAFLYQLGALVAAEYWIYESRIVKHELLKQIQDTRKLIIVGGSSAFFGIDSSLIEKGLGISTYNLGLHAGLPFDFILREITPYLKHGDIVVLHLEYNYYTFPTPYSVWFTDQIMAFYPEYFWQLKAREKIKFSFSVPPQRVLAGGMTKMMGEHLEDVRKRQLKSSNRILGLIHAAWAQKGYRPDNMHSFDNMYSFLNIDPHGDAIFGTGQLNRESAAQYYKIEGLDRDFVESKYFWEVLRDFFVNYRARGVDVYITWPPIVEGILDFNSQRVLNSVRAISERINEIGIPVLGNPSEFQYDIGLFLDTAYHLTSQGKTEHTNRLLGCFKGKGIYFSSP